MFLRAAWFHDELGCKRRTQIIFWKGPRSQRIQQGRLVTAYFVDIHGLAISWYESAYMLTMEET